ncbi:uncharacterized protein A4U43_C06F14600 [Asparagus officinalis]|uniref:Uncharacterized protein n=1 Tax=Asparagus officinalis TaxID=4686 RepID=A0A5P1EMY0_ASPOF|nr:uncharacterized protein LOC109845571 isoform X1 [Asparagus officinalis]ONK67013.1 uncharacterized protein A4U43_C06F14600 [Asparagus officinalis]
MEEVGSLQESQEETDSRPAAEPEKEFDLHIVGSNQNLEEAVETLKHVGVETKAVDTTIVELKSAEKEELDAAVSEKDKEVIGKGEMTSSLAQIVDGLVESEVAGAETNTVMAKENEVTGIPVVSRDVDASIESKAEEEETMDVEPEKNKAVDRTGAERSLDLHWIKDLKYNTRVKDEEGCPAFSLINKVTGEAIKHSIGATHPIS